MTKQNSTQQKKQKSVEETLWDAANKLRGSVEPSEYKHVVLSLIFLKFISDKFVAKQEELIADGKEKYLEMKAFYTKDNVFFLPKEARWSHLVEHAKQDNIAILIDNALQIIEKENKSLKGALPDKYFARLQLDKNKIATLLDTINGLKTVTENDEDFIGKVYMYFLKKFALAEGKGKGEFYTPESIVKLLTELIEPYEGIVYDPCCGSGGMFVQSIDFIKEHRGNKKNVSIYGQEYTATTYKLAKMNLAVRGIAANLGDLPADTFSNDQHKDLKADFILANPPFNQKDWKTTKDLETDARWKGYQAPPSSNANYAWILHMVSKLAENKGIAGFILANGALSGGGDEQKIREQLIENHLVEAVIILPQKMFYTTGISVTIWIINKNRKARNLTQNHKIKQYRHREEEVLFMDLRTKGIPFEKKFIQFRTYTEAQKQEAADKGQTLEPDEIEYIANTFHTWQQIDFETKYQDIPEYCYSASIEEIRKKDYSLVPSKYIEFVNRDENIDFDTKMKSLQSEFAELLKAEEQSKQDLLNVFKELGYEIEL